MCKQIFFIILYFIVIARSVSDVAILLSSLILLGTSLRYARNDREV